MFALVFESAGRPIDRHALARGGGTVDFLGCSRQVALIVSHVGADHAQASLGERFWIAGRIRLDGRRDLASHLKVDAAEHSDAGLCLAAYAAWGEDFLHRLAGDFCFGLWDESLGRLIGARDQLGVRSLFHLAAGATHAMSDSLEWLAAWPDADRTLDEGWIADFLTTGFSQDFASTVYLGVKRLPPAHALTVAADGARLRHYWQLSIDEPLYLRDRRLYPERLRELMSAAILDRLPPGRVGISMSGGVNSPGLAAVAVAATGDPARIVAQCLHHERLIPDDEASFATLAARHLDIELRLRAADDLAYDPKWRERGIRTAEPTSSIVTAHPVTAARREMATAAGVWLFGEGPDNALVFERGPYLRWLRRERRWSRLAEALWLYLEIKGLHGWRHTLGRYLAARPEPSPEGGPPAWLAVRPGPPEDAPAHPWHPKAFASLASPIWQTLFANCDLDEASAPLVWRHPYLDLRVLTFMLSVPPVPWARRKLVLREALRGRLPRTLLERDKAPLAQDPLAAALRRHALPPLAAGHRLKRYVDVGRLPGWASSQREIDGLVAVHALDYWLEQQPP